MGPDRTNYETWLIDWIDGALDNERAALLLAFLDENPDIKEEFSDLSTISLKSGTGQFRNKEALKRAPEELSRHQFELLCVAASEKDLEALQTAELEQILSSDTGKRRTYDLFQKIRLSAPKATFRYKYRLRKLTTSQRIFRYSLTLVSSAAAILVMIVILRKPETGRQVTGTVAVNAITSQPGAGTSLQKPVVEVPSRQSGQSKGYPTAQYSATAFNKIKADEKYSDTDPGIKDPLSTDNKRVDIAKVALSEDGLTRSDPDISLAVINTTPVITDTDQGDNGPGQFIAKLFREKIIKPKEMEKEPLKAYDVANAGVKGLKKLFGWNMSLQKNKDEKGEVKSVSFSSKLISFNAPVKKATHLP
jgi:hypothetical protein